MNSVTFAILSSAAALILLALGVCAWLVRLQCEQVVLANRRASEWEAACRTLTEHGAFYRDLCREQLQMIREMGDRYALLREKGHEEHVPFVPGPAFAIGDPTYEVEAAQARGLDVET